MMVQVRQRSELFLYKQRGAQPTAATSIVARQVCEVFLDALCLNDRTDSLSRAACAVVHAISLIDAGTPAIGAPFATTRGPVLKAPSAPARKHLGAANPRKNRRGRGKEKTNAKRKQRGAARTKTKTVHTIRAPATARTAHDRPTTQRARTTPTNTPALRRRPVVRTYVGPAPVDRST